MNIFLYCTRIQTAHKNLSGIVQKKLTFSKLILTRTKIACLLCQSHCQLFKVFMIGILPLGMLNAVTFQDSADLEHKKTDSPVSRFLPLGTGNRQPNNPTNINLLFYHLIDRRPIICLSLPQPLANPHAIRTEKGTEFPVLWFVLHPSKKRHGVFFLSRRAMAILKV